MYEGRYSYMQKITEILEELQDTILSIVRLLTTKKVESMEDLETELELDKEVK